MNFLASAVSEQQVSLAIGLWLLYMKLLINIYACLTAHMKTHGIISLYMPGMVWL